MREALKRGIKTFLAGAAGVLASAVVIEAFGSGEFKAGAAALGLGLIGALLAGVIAFAQAAAGSTATTPFGRALRTFYQLLAGGLGTVGIASLTTEAFVDFGQAAVRVLVVAAVSGLATLALAESEA
jgi:hypothetical protein